MDKLLTAEAHVAAQIDQIFAATTPDGYTPAELGADLTAGAPQILAWVGVGVAGAVVVMLALIGIRRGLAAFRANAR